MRQYRIVAAGLLAVSILGLGIRYAESAGPASVSQWTEAERAKGYVVFRHSTIKRLTGSHVPGRKAILKKKVSCDLAQGEYESVQIGIHGLAEGVKNVRLDLGSDLEIKVYYVYPRAVYPDHLKKEWYQPGYFATFSTLMPGNVIDSVGKNGTVAFWLTFHARVDTPPGLHRSKIRITSNYIGLEGKSVTELDLEVRVRPFVLQPARAAFGMYFRRDWIPKYSLTDGWLRAMYRDMAEHGQNAVTFYEGGDFSAFPPRSNMVQILLPMAKETGLTDPNVPCMVLQCGLGSEYEQQKAAVKWLKTRCEKNGWPELILYGADEPAYPNPGVRKSYASFRRVPMRLTTAISAHGVYGLGDIHDVWVMYGGQITPEMIAEAKRLGAEVWTYSCHMYGGRPPDRHRYYAGLYTWAYKLGGNWQWAYHWVTWWRNTDIEPLSTLSWECRRDGIDDYRYLQMLEDCLAAKPADRLAVEAGRWLKNLRNSIINGPDPHVYESANVDDNVVMESGKPPFTVNFDEIRAKAADYIELLSPAVQETTKPGLPSLVQWVPGLKDEATLFRGKSVEECMAGLKNSDSSIRRASAWALYEIGPESAPASEELADLLNDPEVRIPALRALEAIGSQAYPAVPKISRLLSHPDGFIRLGATFALGAIGAPWQGEGETIPVKRLSLSQVKTLAQLLRVPLMDELHWVASVAAEALVRMGPAAKPALPEAIKLLDRPYGLFTWGSSTTVRRLIANIGPEARDAVPKLVKIVNDRKGDAPGDILTLAAIGKSAQEAIPALEKYAADEENLHRGRACYALFCIRGKTEDLKKMVNFMKKDEGSRAEMAHYLNALGVNGDSVVGQVREILKSEESAKNKKQLQSFLEKVKKGEGPTLLIP